MILLGMHTGRYAFPSEISDDPLLELVMPEAESFSNAEERRLFYVALTRARHRVYLLGSCYRPSAFLTELVEDESLRSILWHEQGRGNELASRRLGPCSVPAGQAHKRNSPFGEFVRCSKFPNCRYKRPDWAKSFQPILPPYGFS
ncbi:MAG: ATP-binding domain-containing protein [Acidobacteria bacterium]|nr:ATP-binding domain-containing protein [Acidobacteriota bacterium]